MRCVWQRLNQLHQARNIRALPCVTAAGRAIIFITKCAQQRCQLRPAASQAALLGADESSRNLRGIALIPRDCESKQEVGRNEHGVFTGLEAGWRRRQALIFLHTMSCSTSLAINYRFRSVLVPFTRSLPSC